MPVPAKRFSFLNQDTNVGVLDFTDIQSNDIFNIPDNAIADLGTLLSSIQDQLTNVLSENGLLELIDNIISELPIGDIMADILSVMKDVFGDLGVLSGLLSGLSEACLRDIYGMLALCDPDFGGSVNVGFNPCPTGSIDSLFSSIGVSADSLATSVINYGNGVTSSISNCKQNAILAGLISRSSNPEGILEALENKLDPADIETIRNLIESSRGGGTGPDLFDPTNPIYDEGTTSPIRITGSFAGKVNTVLNYSITNYDSSLSYTVELIYKDTSVIYKSFNVGSANFNVTLPDTPINLVLRVTVTGYIDFINDINVLSADDTGTVIVNGPLIVEPNTTTKYNIISYVAGDVYEITVSTGSVTQGDGWFLYTSPSEPGEANISINKTGNTTITKISVNIADESKPISADCLSDTSPSSLSLLELKVIGYIYATTLTDGTEFSTAQVYYLFKFNTSVDEIKLKANPAITIKNDSSGRTGILPGANLKVINNIVTYFFTNLSAESQHFDLESTVLDTSYYSGSRLTVKYDSPKEIFAKNGTICKPFELFFKMNDPKMVLTSSEAELNSRYETYVRNNML